MKGWFVNGVGKRLQAKGLFGPVRQHCLPTQSDIDWAIKFLRSSKDSTLFVQLILGCWAQWRWAQSGEITFAEGRNKEARMLI